MSREGRFEAEEQEERQPTGWRCAGCGEKFRSDAGSHAVHARDCDGSCRSCPVQCGPIYAEYD